MAAGEGGMIKYGQSITYTRADGSIETITADDCDSPDEAKDAAIQFAATQGWTNPRWWQFWRWGDTQFSEEDARRAFLKRKVTHDIKKALADEAG
jgi:hypothetical protein